MISEGFNQYLFSSPIIFIIEDDESLANLLLSQLPFIIPFSVHTLLNIYVIRIAALRATAYKLLHRRIIAEPWSVRACVCLCVSGRYKNVFFNSWWRYVHADDGKQPADSSVWRWCSDMRWKRARTHFAAIFWNNKSNTYIHSHFAIHFFLLLLFVFAND